MRLHLVVGADDPPLDGGREDEGGGGAEEAGRGHRAPPARPPPPQPQPPDPLGEKEGERHSVSPALLSMMKGSAGPAGIGRLRYKFKM